MFAGPFESYPLTVPPRMERVVGAKDDGITSVPLPDLVNTVPLPPLIAAF